MPSTPQKIPSFSKSFTATFTTALIAFFAEFGLKVSLRPVPAGSGGGIAVYPEQDTDRVIDINGYFAAGPNGLSLYPAAPCRAIDTRRVGNGQPFSGDLIVNVGGSICGPPGTAEAYVFNATVVPTGSLGYLTLWPNGQSMPVVSTLNAVDGWITSNIAIGPTMNGSIDAYVSGLTQLILDISSYFAP